MSSQVKIIPANELNALHTGSLLTRLQKLWECEESFACSDRHSDGESEPDPAVTGLIEFKNTAVWKQAFLDVKELLKTRESLPTPAERRGKRYSEVDNSPSVRDSSVITKVLRYIYLF